MPNIMENQNAKFLGFGGHFFTISSHSSRMSWEFVTNIFNGLSGSSHTSQAVGHSIVHVK